MDILVKDNNIIAIASNIELGIYDEDFEKWKLEDENGKLMYYMLNLSSPTLVENVTLPSDYVNGKYFYTNNEFVLNEDWMPYKSPEQRIAELETALNDQVNINNDLTEQNIVFDSVISEVMEGIIPEIMDSNAEQTILLEERIAALEAIIANNNLTPEQ